MAKQKTACGVPVALAQVLVAKYADHLPLYRQETIFGRAGFEIPRSTLAQWVGSAGVQLQPLVDAMRADLLQHRILHADETPVAMLDPGAGKTRRAYLWSYCTPGLQDERLVVFDFAESRAGRHPMEFLGHPGERAWRGTLVCDDYSGYKALFAQGVTEAGCLAHARRKFHELWANHKSKLAEQALALFGRVYEVEREVADLRADERQRIRQAKAKPAADALHARSRATSKTARYPRTTTGWRTRSARSTSGATTGCLPGRFVQASALRRS